MWHAGLTGARVPPGMRKARQLAGGVLPGRSPGGAVYPQAVSSGVTGTLTVVSVSAAGVVTVVSTVVEAPQAVSGGAVLVLAARVTPVTAAVARVRPAARCRQVFRIRVSLSLGVRKR